MPSRISESPGAEVRWIAAAGGSALELEEGDHGIVGKAPDCELVLDLPGVSRRHLELSVREGRLFARDLGSMNGSSCGGMPIASERAADVSAALEVTLGGAGKITFTRKSGPSLAPGDGFGATEDKLVAAFGEALARMAAVGEELATREQKLDVVLASDWGRAFAPSERARLRRELLEAGPITDLLLDPSISEIAANGARSLWIERNGAMLPVDGAFVSEQSLLAFVRRMLAPLGRTLDTRNPVVDARLPDGSRICAVTAPAVLGGTHLSVRRFTSGWSRIERLVESGSMGEAAALYLAKAVEDKRNILVSGSTGAGKTTLLNAIASRVPRAERIVTLEDTAELQIEHPHIVRLESRPPNLEGEGEITIRQLLRTALRLRPDRLIVGECRGAEALDLLQALNTGHAGSMSTIHANSSRDALARLELLCLLGSGNSLQPAIARTYIASAVQVLVHLGRRNGRRVLETIDEITGVDEGVVLLRRIYACA